MARKGFTFIELLLAISIFSVVAIGIYSAFNTGIFAWRRLSDATDAYQHARLTLELMGEQIANFVSSESFKLEGAPDRITFLSAIYDKEGQAKLAKVSFYLEPSKNILEPSKNIIMRSQQPLKSVLKEPPSQTTSTSDVDNALDIIVEEFSQGIKTLEFEYFCKKAGTQDEYEWVGLLDPKNPSICKAVRISIKDGVTFKKVVPLYVESKNVQKTP